MKRWKVLSTSVASALLLVLSFGSPAAAFELLKQTGQTGDYGVRSGDSEARCSYTGPSVPGGTTLKSIRVFPVFVGSATDGTQKVSWTVAVQKSTDNGAHWQTIKTGPPQIGHPTPNVSPIFKQVTLNVSGRLNAVYRATTMLKWFTGSSTTGLVKIRHQSYEMRIGTEDQSNIQDDYCFGKLLD